MCASDIELESIKHVAFEVASVERWADLFLEGGGRCRFEVFLLHSRLLREFLWVNSDDRYPQDLRLLSGRLRRMGYHPSRLARPVRRLIDRHSKPVSSFTAITDLSCQVVWICQPIRAPEYQKLRRLRL